MLSVTILTLFPELFPGPLGISVLAQAIEKKIWTLKILPLRQYAKDARKTVDGPGYGGGEGMIMRPDVIDTALKSMELSKLQGIIRYIYPSPRGAIMNQEHFFQIAQDIQSLEIRKKELFESDDFSQLGEEQKNISYHLVILCGRYEGVDQRVLDAWNFEEWSLGDFILCGGELAAMAMTEAIVRLLPGVLGNPLSAKSDSFSLEGNFPHLLEYPLYTQPKIWNEMEVPPVLLSGNHQNVRNFRHQTACALTQSRRPDLWKKYQKYRFVEALKNKHSKKEEEEDF